MQGNRSAPSLLPVHYQTQLTSPLKLQVPPPLPLLLPLLLLLPLTSVGDGVGFFASSCVMSSLISARTSLRADRPRSVP
jgi:hypothetical protein